VSISRDSKKGGNELHAGIIEMYLKDRLFQEQMREEFTQNPKDFRERMMQIEATAQGLQKRESDYFNTSSKKQASEKEMEKLLKATDDAMLRQNPKIAENNLEYKGGFIIPLNYKALSEKVEGGI
tara:strand:- start:447 stop:821 length:375 start_codon:yes stop_codon:yes gene_type:complete